MGLDSGEFWWRISRFNWFGHQSRFDRGPAALGRLAPFTTGDLLSLVIFPPTRLSRMNAPASRDSLPEDESIPAIAENNHFSARTLCRWLCRHFGDGEMTPLGAPRTPGNDVQTTFVGATALNPTRPPTWWATPAGCYC